MAKKRKLTKEEIAIHNEAVKLRKLSDGELVAKCRGVANAKNAKKTAEKDNGSRLVRRFIDTLIDGKCAGIGEKTAQKLNTYAVAAGFIKDRKE